MTRQSASDSPAPPAIPPVRQAAIVRAGAAAVWEALSTREGWEGWFSNRCLVDLRPGGFLHFRWRDFGPERFTGDSRADVESVEPRRGLAFHWQGHPSKERTRVRFRLEPRGPITVVRVEETGFGDLQHALDNSGGWGACLANLKVWVEHGIRFDGRPAAAAPVRRRVDGGRSRSVRR